MRQVIVVLLAIVFFALFGYSQQYQKDLERIKRQNQYELIKIDENTIKLKHKLYGRTKVVHIVDQNISLKKISGEMQIFDLINADTNLYKHKYQLKGRVLVAGALGYPMAIEDLNNNGKPDFVGGYKIIVDYNISDCAIAELQSDSTFSIQEIYTDSVVTPLAVTDVDNNGLNEINLKKAGGQFFYNYESLADNSYPDTIGFKYRMWEMCGSIGSETFVDMDNDGITDVVYKGDDTLEPSGTKIYVSEYDANINNFVKRFSFRPEHFRVSGFSIGDFDKDGYKEFVTGSIDGDVYVFENSGNDSYDFIFSDTISTPNAYLTCAANDMDNNGKIEFFVGGSSYYNGIGGTKVYWFEADGNNNYNKKYTFFLSGTDVLGITEMYSYDVNADNIDDLVFAFSGSVVILIWNSDGYFELFYLDWLEDWDKEIHSVNIYDTYNTGRPDLYISYNDYHKAPAVYSDYFINNFITGITENIPTILKEVRLFQNYPNPFNNSTIIKFKLNKPQIVNLKIMDINGREVIILSKNKSYGAGNNEIRWNGKNKFGKEVSSGIYLYVISNGKQTLSGKMLLIK